MSKLYGLIPAAGKGTRARPYTSEIPKSMLEINGVPNLQRNIEIMRDQMGITEIVIVIGYMGQVITDFFEDGKRFGVTLYYVSNTQLDRGLAWSVLLGKEIIDDYFCVILSDECYVNSNHHELKKLNYRDAFATCAIQEVDDKEIIKRNYSVTLENRWITGLVEKPTHIDNDILGCGTFIFSNEIFSLLAEEFSTAPDNYVEFISFIDAQCRNRRTVQAFWLTGCYVNINDRDSLAQAKYNERNHYFPTLTKTLLIYSEGTEDNISFTIERYRKVPQLNRIIVIVPHENNISDIVHEHGVECITCPPECQLYGQKIHYACDRIDSDIQILAEADYAFPARDIEKLLAYLKEADMVVGTRTTRQLMEQGSDLQGMVRMANVFVAKLQELLWWRFEGRFTDVGCTFRAFWSSSYRKVSDDLHSKGPEFSAEMMLEMLNHRMRVLEVPVNYHNVSRALNAKYRNLNTFFRFLGMLIVKRCHSAMKKNR